MAQKAESGVTTLGLLGIVFVVLKLTNYIDWSWWWVTAPFWGGFAVGIAIILIALVGLLLLKVVAVLFPSSKLWKPKNKWRF